jgi:hypothetical protein
MRSLGKRSSSRSPVFEASLATAVGKGLNEASGASEVRPRSSTTTFFQV